MFLDILAERSFLVSPSISSCSQVSISIETWRRATEKTAKNSAAMQQQQAYAKDLMIAKIINTKLDISLHVFIYIRLSRTRSGTVSESQ